MSDGDGMIALLAMFGCWIVGVGLGRFVAYRRHRRALTVVRADDDERTVN